MDTREYWINKIEDKNFYEDLALQFLFFNRQNFDNYEKDILLDYIKSMNR